MTADRTEERLRDALGAIRRQSIEGHSPGGSIDAGTGLSDLDDEGHGSHRRWLPAVAAVLLILIGIAGVAARPGDQEANVTASRPDEAEVHGMAVAQVAEGCRRFQVARPQEAAPAEDPAQLEDWFNSYVAALEQAREDLGDVTAGSNADAEVLVRVEATLTRVRRALDGARSAAAASDAVEAVRLIDQARSYESIAAFELAEWGATECDPRGVTRPTR